MPHATQVLCRAREHYVAYMLLKDRHGFLSAGSYPRGKRTTGKRGTNS
jgi:hypothetical protein